MHRMRLSLIAAVVIASWCQGQSRPAAETRPESAESAPAGDPSAYAKLFKYCPEKLESLMLVTAKGVPDEFKDFLLPTLDFRGEYTQVRAVRVLWAGQRFSPRNDYEGVRVYELERPIALASVINEDNFNYEAIDGVPCFVGKPKSEEYGPLEDWVTLVDRKYLIFATRRSIMKAVLAGRGPSPETVVERLGWKPAEVRFGSPFLIIRKYVAEKGTPPWVIEAVVERLQLAYDPATKRCLLDVVSKDGTEALRLCRGMAEDHRPDSRVSEEDEIPPEMLERWTYARVEPLNSNGDRHVFTLTINRDHDWPRPQPMAMIYGVSLMY